MPSRNKPALSSPWAEFLEELDALLSDQVEVHCIGGFVVSLHYGLPRVTGDIDYLAAEPVQCIGALQEVAGLGSPLAKKYKVHFEHVTVTNLPEGYKPRLVEMFPGRFKKLRLYAPDPYDLILSKLQRNSSKDRDDAEYLARTYNLKSDILRQRYEDELRPYLTYDSRDNVTLNIWLESCFPS